MSNEWISCDERLPKIRECVEVKTYNNSIEKSVIVNCKDNTFCWDQYNIEKNETITHWRPIPEKRPDFSKLKAGDAIKIEIISGGFVIGFFDFIVGDIIKINGDLGVEKLACKKITIANFEEQTFEEI